MIKLINGRGQLGTALQDLIKEKNPEGNMIIYHTWNFLDKSEKTQRECYEGFKRFVDENKNSGVVFVSTYSQTDNFYNHYKHLSEDFLLKNNQNGRIIRLPTLIGKGTCEGFREERLKAWGNIELMTIKEAAEKVLEFTQSYPETRIASVEGTLIPAKLVKNLILFGKYGK